MTRPINSDEMIGRAFAWSFASTVRHGVRSSSRRNRKQGFGYGTGLDSRSGTVQFRVPVPHVLGTHGGFGQLTIPGGNEAVMMFAASPKRVDLLHLPDDGSTRTSTVVEFGDSDATLSHFAGVYPDGHGAVRHDKDWLLRKAITTSAGGGKLEAHISPANVALVCPYGTTRPAARYFHP